MTTPEPYRPRPAWSETPTRALPIPPHTGQLPVGGVPADEEPQPSYRRFPRGLIPGLVVLALAGFAAFGVALGTGASYNGQTAGPAPSTTNAPTTTNDAAPQTTTPDTTTAAPDTTTPLPVPQLPEHPGAGDAAGGPAGSAAGGPAVNGPGRAGHTGPRG